MSGNEHPVRAQWAEAALAGDPPSLPPPSLNSFPTELIGEIYPLLELQDAVSLSLSCKRLYAILAPETCRDLVASWQFTHRGPADLAEASQFAGDFLGVDRFKYVEFIELSSDFIRIAVESGLMDKLADLKEIRLFATESDQLLPFFALFSSERDYVFGSNLQQVGIYLLDNQIQQLGKEWFMLPPLRRAVRVKHLKLHLRGTVLPDIMDAAYACFPDAELDLAYNPSGTSVRFPIGMESKVTKFSCDTIDVAAGLTEWPLFRPRVVHLACFVNEDWEWERQAWRVIWANLMRLDSIKEIEVCELPTICLTTPIPLSVEKLYIDHIFLSGLDAAFVAMVEDNLVAFSNREGTSIKITGDPAQPGDLSLEQVEELALWMTSPGLSWITTFSSQMLVLDDPNGI